MQKKNKMIDRLYVLALNKPEHFYVGISSREIFDLPDGTAYGARLLEHAQGNGSRFSKKHGFKKCILHAEVAGHAASTLEDDMTKYLMARYGWQQVRGGRYVRCIDDDKTYWLPREIQEAMTCQKGKTSFRDILELRAGGMSQFPAELRRLVDRFCAVCGS